MRPEEAKACTLVKAFEQQQYLQFLLEETGTEHELSVHSSLQ